MGNPGILWFVSRFIEEDIPPQQWERFDHGAHLGDVIMEPTGEQLLALSLLTLRCFLQPRDTERVKREKTGLQLLQPESSPALTAAHGAIRQSDNNGSRITHSVTSAVCPTFWLTAVQMSIFNDEMV